MNSVSLFVKGVEILPDGSVARTGTNYSVKFQEAHDASKASIQSRISNLESGGVKGTGDIDNPIRTYRGVELQNIDPVYIADQRTVVEMPFVGKGEKYTNAEGWRRDLKYFWSELLDRHPEAFSPNNRAIIEGRNPFTDSPVNDKVFREYFSQYDVKGVRGGQISSSSYWWRWTSISSAPKTTPRLRWNS